MPGTNPHDRPVHETPPQRVPASGTEQADPRTTTNRGSSGDPAESGRDSGRASGETRLTEN